MGVTSGSHIFSGEEMRRMPRGRGTPFLSMSATPLLPSVDSVSLLAWLLRSLSVAFGEHGLPGEYPAFLASCM